MIFSTRLVKHMKFISPVAYLFLLLVPFFFSCSVAKPTYYFKNITRDTVINSVVSNNEELKIKKADVLGISISSLSKEEDEIYNKPALQSSGQGASVQGFPVDREGNIYLHKVGKVKAEGMTRNEFKIYLEKQLQPYLKDPVVIVNFANHYVTVIGEVGKPQLLNMPDEKISIIDVLAQSGNVNPIAQMNNLMVVREKDGTSKEFKHINLEDQSIFTSPWYYLQPNDIVVVNPDEKRVLEEQKRARYQQTTSIILQALSIVIIITQIFRN
jgi:polysaccharide biosynthesis/export protein